MPTFNTSIKVMAIDIPVEVHYKIISEGSSPSYCPMYGADGGDPPEIEILSIEKKSNGEDITEWCGKTFSLDKDTCTITYLETDKGWRDPIRTIIFNDYYLYNKYVEPWRLTIKLNSPTFEELIYNKIIASDDFAEACRDYGDYD